jgi:hypothetical protein
LKENPTHGLSDHVVISACLYLSSKINEVEGGTRVRDFINGAIYAGKEDIYIQGVLSEGGVEEEGIKVIEGQRVFNDYNVNQFKFMPSNSEMDLF